MVAKETGYGPVFYLKYTKQEFYGNLLKIGITSIFQYIASASPGNLNLSNFNILLNFQFHHIISDYPLSFSVIQHCVLKVNLTF